MFAGVRVFFHDSDDEEFVAPNLEPFRAGDYRKSFQNGELLSTS